jgi:hypothetical protein
VAIEHPSIFCGIDRAEPNWLDRLIGYLCDLGERCIKIFRYLVPNHCELDTEMVAPVVGRRSLNGGVAEIVGVAPKRESAAIDGYLLHKSVAIVTIRVNPIIPKVLRNSRLCECVGSVPGKSFS